MTAKKKRLGVPPPVPPIPEEGGCCEACNGLATGLWGMPWRDAAGTWHCLEGPTAGDKPLRGNANGPYWSNV